VAFALLAVDFDDRIHHHVLGKTNELLEVLEEIANSRMAFRLPKAAAFQMPSSTKSFGDIGQDYDHRHTLHSSGLLTP